MKKLLACIVFLCSLSTYSQTYNYDVNGDGKETIEDVSSLINHLLGKDKQTYTINGTEYPMPELIDLGLPSGTLWANSEHGFHYTYLGSTSVRKDLEEYTDTYPYYPSIPFTCYNYENYTCYKISKEYDIVSCSVGKNYSIPTKEQMQELIDNCNISIVGDADIKFESKINHNSVMFYHSALWGTSNDFITSAEGGFLWLSSIDFSSYKEKIYGYSFTWGYAGGYSITKELLYNPSNLSYRSYSKGVLIVGHKK